MIQQINEPVGIITVYTPEGRTPIPWMMKWSGRYYKLRKVDLCHPVWEGRTLHHIYSLSDGVTYFRLDFNTRSQQWTLVETDDGLPA